MNDDGIYDMDSPAATAAHDQAMSEAMAAIRRSEHFIVSTIDAKGLVGVMVSAPFSFVFHTERMLAHESARLLAAEVEELSMDDMREMFGEEL